MINRLSILTLLFTVFLAASACPIEMRLIGALKGDDYGDRLGDACEGLGDINGDGYNDFLMASFTSRELRLYLGGPHPFDSSPVITWDNHGTIEGLFSFSPVNVGDIDCDGVNDFISVFGNDDTLKLFIGLENLDPDDYLVLFADSSETWNFRIGGGGDNNNDGRPDFWIFPWDRLDSIIYGYSGCDILDTVPDFQIIQSDEPDRKYGVLGCELCTTCDLNGDSIPEIIYGQYTSYPDYPGRVCVVWGGENLSTTPDLVFYAPYEHGGNRAFGQDLACLGDISGDGIDDLWVSQGGRNYIYHGGQPFDTIPDLALDWSYMYADVENVGDINNDGWNDVMLVYNGYLFSFISFIYCYPGMDTLVDAVFSDESYFSYISQGPMCCFGIDHSWVGDVDGDGIDDALISARVTNTNHLDHGWLIVQAGWDDPATGIDDDSRPAVPAVLELKQNYPNPFNSGTMIEFSLPKSGHVELKIYNLVGELVATLLKGMLSAGEHQINWDGRDTNGEQTPTGVYFYQVKSGDYSQTRKMVLLR